MQHDSVIWQLIGNDFCSFKQKIENNTFCRNEYNVTGLCSKQTCPLANSQYATVREEKGKSYLMLKTIERAHTPANMWERVELPRNYAAALAVIDERLQYWPKFLLHKCKQRFTRITQYLIRMRRLRKKPLPKLVGISKKRDRRQAGREKKAEMAARLSKTIQRELLQRLDEGVYEGIVNFPEREYNEVMDGREEELEVVEEAEPQYDFFVEDEQDIEDGLAQLQYEEEEEEDELLVEGLSYLDQLVARKRRDTKRPKHRHLEIEYEVESDVNKNFE